MDQPIQCDLLTVCNPIEIEEEKFTIVKIHENTEEYKDIINKFSELLAYKTLDGLFKIHNPLIDTMFSKKADEYERRGEYQTKELFHDTARQNKESIAEFNFDWRRGTRRLYGPGVYFSISPNLANQYSSKNNGILRTLFLAEVLIQKIQMVFHEDEKFVPNQGYDTVLGHRNETYVKYVDHEFFPKYCIDYKNSYSFTCE